VYDSVLSGSRYLGLIVWSYDQKNVDIRFDNFTVWPIECGGDVNSVNILGELQPASDALPLDFRPHGHGLEK
jgi:hypothetical protein